MANGQQVAEENFRKFSAWTESRTDADFRALVWRGSLSRKDIVAECGITPSSITQNPRIRKALSELEAALRERGVLPAEVKEGPEAEDAEPRMRQPARDRQAALDAERRTRLEQENASLKAQNDELKRLVARYKLLQDALSESGRLPR